MSRRWRQIYRRILARQVPHAILSWRYLLPRQSRMVHLHRNTFLQAWADYPRWVWCLIALYSYSLWYLFHAWRQVFRIWHRQSESLQQQEGISRIKQFFALLGLALLHTTPPHFYYQYRLYRYPERDWLNFVYTHELPHWHRALSPNISARSQHLMSHKHDFAREMARLGLPTVEAVQLVTPGDDFPEALLFSRRSWFFKPEQGSRKEGCFALHYEQEMDRYRLEGEGVQGCADLVEIKALLLRHLRSKPYLIQPLLANHPQLSDRCRTKTLATIRLITAMQAGRPKAVSAILEVPLPDCFDYVSVITIELESGVLQDMSDAYRASTDERREFIQQLAGFQLPDWQQVVDVAEQAHQSFTDIHSIGWDLAISSQGVIIIEGNINWAVAPHQLQGPDKMMAIYD